MNKNWKKHKLKAYTIVLNIIQVTPALKEFKYNKITIRNQKTRWGSCSSKKNLNFNYKIIYLPSNVAKYLVIHEFCHLKEMNHSKKYWELVAEIEPNYKALHKKLHTYSNKIFSD